MRISLLLQREPFGEIAARTLERFLPLLTGMEHRVRWHSAPPRKVQKEKGEQLWPCNIYLNAIFSPQAEPGTLDPVIREFSRSVVAWRRPIQKTYVGMASRQPTASLMAQATVGISPPPPHSDSWLMVGGNNKLRLLNRKAGWAYGVLKEGFSDHFMEQEIVTRQRAEALGLPVPQLLDVADDRFWFKEAYVSGTPINRLPDPAQTEKALFEAWDALQTLRRDSEEEVALSDYAEQLENRISGLLSNFPLFSPKEREEVRGIARSLANHLKMETPRTVSTALTHGDFQAGNILLDGERIWLIDWEFSERRQSDYDALVYGLRTRFPTGLVERLQSFISDGVDEQTRPLAEKAGLQWEERKQRETAARLLLLEDLALHLTLNANPLTKLDEGFRLLLDELRRWPQSDVAN